MIKYNNYDKILYKRCEIWLLEILYFTNPSGSAMMMRCVRCNVMRCRVFRCSAVRWMTEAQCEL